MCAGWPHAEQKALVNTAPQLRQAWASPESGGTSDPARGSTALAMSAPVRASAAASVGSVTARKNSRAPASMIGGPRCAAYTRHSASPIAAAKVGDTDEPTNARADPRRHGPRIGGLRGPRGHLVDVGGGDLQGNWPIMHLFATRLQRDPKFGDRRELDDQEWQAADAGLQRRDERYQDEIKTNKMGMGHWAETTTRTEAARLTSLISYPTDGQLPKLTARGEDLAPTFRSDDTQTVFDSVNDFDAWDRCITRGLPASMLPFNYNNGVRIHQAPGYVVIDLEMIHEARVVPLGLPPLDPAIKQWMGESRGHWDGATLV